MNNDLGKKVQQIAQMLDQEDIPENAKELIALLASSLAKKEGDGSSKEGDGSHIEQKELGNYAQKAVDSAMEEGDSYAQKAVDSASTDKSFKQELDISPEMLNTAMKAMNRIKSVNDPRINLLQAIKPFMNTRRQKKIRNCIQLLQLAGISRLLDDHEK